MGGKTRLQKILQMNSKEHFKSYKAGKIWLYTSIAGLAVGFGLVSGPSLTSQAATVNDGNPTAAPATPASAADNNSATADSTNTDNLKTTAAQLQSTVDTAKSTGVTVTQEPSKTVTTTPDQLANTVASVKSDYTQQEQALQTATTKQQTNNATYATAKQNYDNDVVDIKSTNTQWTDAELVKLLAGEGDKTDVTGTTDVTNAERVSASDQAKAAAEVSLQPGYTVTNADGSAIKQQPLTTDTQPSWTYHNAFVDPKTGDMVNVVETITGFTPSKGSTQSYYLPVTNYIGFQPFNVSDVTAKLDYVDARTGDPVTIDAVVGMSDLDGNQGITINNDYKTLLRGGAIADVDGVYRDHLGSTFEDTNPQGQVWVLQKGVTETDYTFYVGLNPDGTVNNANPLQYIGGASFSVKVPTAPKLTSETASYTETSIQETTNYTVHYVGAGNATPTDSATPVTWTGSYDATSGEYTWTPDQTAINVASPAINGFNADTPQAIWTLGDITADPANQNLTVTYHPNLTEDGQVTLTTHFVDQDGNSIADSTVQKGDQGESFEATAPVIDGYTPVGQTTENGTYQGNQMDLTFVYDKEGQVPDEDTQDATSVLTTHYVDENGNAIADPTTQTGTRGNDFTTQAIAVNGYTPVGDNTVTGTYQGNQMDVTFVYGQEGQVPNEAEDTSVVTVHYVDQDGNEIADPTTYSGPQGEDFATKALSIPGYTPIGRNAVDSAYQGNQMLVTFVYAKEGQVGDSAISTLVVHYVDENGNPVSPDTQQTGKIGDPFTVNAKDVSGYTPNSDNSVSGTYQGNQMVLTFVYHQVPATNNTSTVVTTPPETPQTPEAPVNNENLGEATTDDDTNQSSAADTNAEPGKTTSTSATSGSAVKNESKNMAGKPEASASHATAMSSTTATQTPTVSNQAKASTLPQTNEDTTSQAGALLGMSILASLAGLFGISRRRKEQQ